MKETGILYIVPTPVGNREDMTFRAVRILQEVTFIAAEDTRTSGHLLQHYNINTPLRSYHKFNEKQRTGEWIQRLTNGDSIAIISDAGTPGISDPCHYIVKGALEANINVVCLPGATAFVPALVASGLPTDQFLFVGFLPKSLKERDSLMKTIKSLPATLCFYEAPHRIVATMEYLYAALGDREAVLAREISKVFETFHRGTLNQLATGQVEITKKGEMILLVEGAKPQIFTEEEIEKQVQILLNQGERPKDIANKLAAMTGETKKSLYEIALNLKT